MTGPLEALACALNEHDRTGAAPTASVAAILTLEADPHLLFIHRVAHERDPWSGHLAFPGGKIEPGDGNSRAAAERETREEVGLDLVTSADYVGQLDDLTGASIRVSVTCHVYGIGRLPELTLNYEVEDAFAIALSDLADQDRWLESDFEIRGTKRVFPAIDLGLDGKPLLWGLTYRFVCQILHHADLVTHD